MKTIILVALAYICGSVPVGYLLASVTGVDIRRQGSGNIGATNVARVVGWRRGVLTLVGDVLKGVLPVLLAFYFGLQHWAIFWIGLASFLGHLYPVFLKFQGGKGVATALGILLAVAPAGALILALVFALVAASSRAVSVASIIAAALAPVVLWLVGYPLPFVWLSVVFALLIVVRHRQNIQRLLAGVEPKFKVNSQR